MFDKIIIKNFQSHRDTNLLLDKGVNVLLGTSLNGKTAIARAINLIINNRPSGAKFYSNFAPDQGKTIIELKPVENTSVVIEKQIKRKSDKTKELIGTIYKFGGEEFSGVAKDVPDVIRRVFNISELNIQKQFDQPFLILSSAGEFAKTINRVTKLEKVDEWVKELTRRINKSKNEMSLLESQIKDNEIELKKYIGFEKLEKNIVKLKNIDDSVNKLEENFYKLNRLLDKYELIDEELLKIKPSVLILEKIIVILEKEKEMEKLENYLSRIEDINNYIKNQKILYNECNKELIKILENTKECPLFLLPCPAVKEMVKKVKK